MEMNAPPLTRRVGKKIFEAGEEFNGDPDINDKPLIMVGGNAWGGKGRRPSPSIFTHTRAPPPTRKPPYIHSFLSNHPSASSLTAERNAKKNKKKIRVKARLDSSESRGVWIEWNGMECTSLP